MSRPWFPFYVGDYTRDTARLTTEAHGAYLLLMLDYWVNGAPPDEDETLATITKLPLAIWKKRRPALVKFFKVKDGQWTHARIEKEKARAEEVGASNSDKAREAAERRWAKDRERKLQEQSEQCPGDAPSIDRALPQNAQSQSLSPSKSDSKKGESNSRSDLKVVSEEGKPQRIDENYQPSDRMIEYAYSLGMKKGELNSELSKFIADGMALRKVSFDVDASFKKWCEHWLNFKRRNDPNWNPQAEKPASAVVPSTVWIDEGTQEWSAHQSELHRTTGRGSPVTDHRDEHGAGTGRRGWYFKSLWPDGYNDFGERVAPASEDAA